MKALVTRGGPALAVAIAAALALPALAQEPPTGVKLAPAPARPIATPGQPGITPAPAGPAGKVEITETSHDAGNVERGTDVKHAFTIKNVGEHPLTVEAKPG